METATRREQTDAEQVAAALAARSRSQLTVRQPVSLEDPGQPTAQVT
jgi:hypothetical protein